MPDNDYQYERCYVAFLDILGFSHKVMQSQNKEEILRRLVNTLDICACIPSGGKKVANINGEERTLAIQSRYCSDTIGFFMKENAADLPQMLLIIRYLQDLLWALGIGLRGGITIGEMYWNPNDPNITLGAGWIDAYKLESEVAIYPRIVVADELYASLRDHPAYPFGTTGSIHDYIAKDHDGVHFLDLLNPNILRKRYEGINRTGDKFSIVWNETEESSWDVSMSSVEAMINREMRNATPRVRQKYYWLKSYMSEKGEFERLDIKW